MVEVFKTDVGCAANSAMLIQKLRDRYPDLKVNFDLEDCDRVLRVEADVISVRDIASILTSEGFNCEEL